MERVNVLETVLEQQEAWYGSSCTFPILFKEQASLGKWVSKENDQREWLEATLTDGA